MKNRVVIYSGIGVLFVFGIFYLVNINIQTTNFNKIIQKDVESIMANFENLQGSSNRMLSSTLESLIQNEEMKKIYLEKDRDKLYNYVNPLFENLKKKYGITHWNFILPDGTTFLRVHNKDIYGDEVTRFTFYSARDSGEVFSGIDLGKTAYVFRVIMPYYDDDKLIGYMETGEEVAHFFKDLKAITKNEFILVAEKKFLDEEEWKSVRSVAGLRNNWDDSLNHLIVYSIETEKLASQCFSDNNVYLGLKGQLLFQEIKNGGESYRCVGFPITDAKGINSGIIFSALKTTSYKRFVNEINLIIIGFLTLLFIFIMLIIFLLCFPKRGKTKKIKGRGGK